MTPQDFSQRLVIVVRKDIEGWQVANTIAHISAYVGNKLKDSFGTAESFVFADGKEIPRNSQYPMIIKAAETADQVKEVFDLTRQEGLLSIGFIREMIDCTGDAQIEAILKDKSYADAELLGFGVFGENEQIKSLTRKFSLWK